MIKKTIIKRPSNLKEKFQQVVGNTSSVTEGQKKATKVDTSDESEPSSSPLSDAFRKAKHPERLEKKKIKRASIAEPNLGDQEEADPEFGDGPDRVPPYMKDEEESWKKNKTKKKEEPIEEEEIEEKEEAEVLEEKPDASKKKSGNDTLTDDEIDGIDESTLTDSKGRPPSREAWKTVKLLKAKISDMRRSHDDIVADLSKKAVKVEESEPYLATKKERDELKKKMDDLYFEHSDDFKNTFVVPFEDKEKQVAEWLGMADVEDKSPEQKAAIQAVEEFQKAMMAGNKKGFYIALAESAQFVPAGVDAQLLKDAGELYELYQKKQAAYKDKDASRKETQATELSQVDSATKVIDKTMDEVFESYETENEQILEFYRSDAIKDVIKYDEIVNKGKKEVKAIIREVIATRKPSAKLVRILSDAVLKPFKDQEVEALRSALASKNTIIENMEKELNTKRGHLKKLATTRTSPAGGDDEDDDGDKPKFSSTPLSDAFRKRQMAS